MLRVSCSTSTKLKDVNLLFWFFIDFSLLPTLPYKSSILGREKTRSNYLLVHEIHKCAESLLHYPAENVMCWDYMWGEELIEYVLGFFKPKNMRIDVVSKSFDSEGKLCVCVSNGWVGGYQSLLIQKDCGCVSSWC